MARVVVSSLADADTAAILTYLSINAGPRVAARYNGLFESFYDRIEAFPGCGLRRPVLGPDIRIGIASPFIIIYHYSEDDDVVTVLRLVHGRRRISGVLLGGGG